MNFDGQLRGAHVATKKRTHRKIAARPAFICTEQKSRWVASSSPGLAARTASVCPRLLVAVRRTRGTFTSEQSSRRQVNESHSGFEIFCRHRVRVCARRGGDVAGASGLERGE